MKSTALCTAFALCLGALAGCDDSPPPKNPFEPPPKDTVAPPKLTAPPKPKGPPELAIDELGPKVGFSRVLLDKPEGRDKLAKEIKEIKEHYDGKEATLSVIRKAKMVWVMTMMQELGKIGATKVIIKTDTREEFPKELAFTPLARAPEPEPCALVGLIMEDRSSAIWKVGGGLAMRRAKGFAGPDLSTTAETIERMAKACKQSNMFFVSAAENVEWGLAYDLAASTRKIEDVKFDHVLLLEKFPTAGRKVDLN